MFVEYRFLNAGEDQKRYSQQIDFDRDGNVWVTDCLLYTSDAADERSSVDLGGRRILKKKQSDTCHGARRISESPNDG